MKRLTVKRFHRTRLDAINTNSMVKRWSFLFALAFINWQIISATKYYVSNSSGSDASGRDGKSESTAWKTLAKISSMTIAPGDTILLRKGDMWRENLTVPSSGTPSAYIVFGSYGTGSNPRILGSEVSSGWTNYSGNVWVSASSFSDPRSSFNCDVFFEVTGGSVNFGLNKTSIGNLASEYDWTWSGNKIYIYSPTDPATRYAGIEIPQRQSCMDLNNREYLEINGISMFYGIYEGITYNWNYSQQDLRGLKIENCEIGYIGGSITNYTYENGFGIDVAYSDMTVRKCEIHDCGRRSISFHLYGSGFTVRNVLIEQNYFHNGYHTTGVDISVGSGSYTGSFDGVTIRRNIFYDPPASPYHSEQIFIQNYNYATLATSVNNINIYSNIFRSPSGSGIMAEGTQSVYIYNNTFYNHNTTKTGNVAHLWIDANNDMIKVKNNIFYTDLSFDTGGAGLEIYCLTDPSKIDADFNLYYRITNFLRIIKVNTNNFYMISMLLIQSLLGWEKDSPAPRNPQFIDPANNNFDCDTTSVAQGNGLNLGIPVDYNGNAFDSLRPSIGAIEINPKASGGGGGSGGGGNGGSGSGGGGGGGGGGVPPVGPPPPENLLLIYPNPSRGTITVVREGASLSINNFKIYDISGRLVFEGMLGEGVRSTTFTTIIHSGIYIVQLLSDNIISDAQKMIISN